MKKNTGAQLTLYPAPVKSMKKLFALLLVLSLVLALSVQAASAEEDTPAVRKA